MTKTPDKIAHIHLMRTAGTFVSSYLAHELRDTHDIRVSWFDGMERDWHADELLTFAVSDRPIYVHNHVAGWSQPLVNHFRDAGFLTFAFVRDPRDQLCSLFRLIERRKVNSLSLTLDQFVRAQLARENVYGIDHRHWAVPAWWRDLCFVASYTDKAFESFLVEQLNRDWCQQAAQRGMRNASDNQPFEWYCETGRLSDATVEAVTNSAFFEDYLEVTSHPNAGSVGGEHV